MIVMNDGPNTILLPNPRLGDSDETESPFILGRQTTNMLERYSDSNWPGKRTYTWQIDLPKCTDVYNTFAELDAFLLLNNGMLSISITVDYPDGNNFGIGLCIVFCGTVEESLYYWHVQLIVVVVT